MKAMQIALRMVTDRNQCQQNAICSFTRRNVLIAELDAGGGGGGGDSFGCFFFLITSKGFFLLTYVLSRHRNKDTGRFPHQKTQIYPILMIMKQKFEY